MLNYIYMKFFNSVYVRE